MFAMFLMLVAIAVVVAVLFYIYFKCIKLKYVDTAYC